MTENEQAVATTKEAEDTASDRDSRNDKTADHEDSSSEHNKNDLKVTFAEPPKPRHRVREGVTVASTKLKQKSAAAYESSPWCSPIRKIYEFPRKWPRVCAVFFGMVLPLWLLIFVSSGFGALLASFESDSEIEGNDGILAARKMIEYSYAGQEVLLDLPVLCFEEYVDKQLNASNTTEVTLFLDECADRFSLSFERGRKIREEASNAFDSLSFNWIRCWPEELDPPAFIFHPSEALINASHPDFQEQTYSDEWNTMQQELYEKYLPEDASPDEEFEAFQRSVEEATGGDTCTENIGGSAWFFFTIMTTVGYGNQAPTTTKGRALIFSAGFFSLILFAAVLSTAGYILTAIFDDFVRRNWLSKWLKYPWVGVVLWGCIWTWWSLLIATDAEWWWGERLPDFEVGRADALWFAYISTSTIGLGDYFLPPEMMFGSDSLKFSLIFLIGFVFLSTFFGKIVAAIATLMPRRHNSFEARLRSTRFLACWDADILGCKFKEVKDGTNEYQERVDALQAFLSDYDEDNEQHAPETIDKDACLALVEEEEAIVLELMQLVQKRRERLLEMPSQEEEDPNRKGARANDMDNPPSASLDESQSSARNISFNRDENKIDQGNPVPDDESKVFLEETDKCTLM